jgi:hypothetical protein
MALEPDKMPGRSLEEIASATLVTYNGLFLDRVLPLISEGKQTPKATEEMIAIFEESLPKNEDERKNLLDTLEQNLLPISAGGLAGAYVA